MAPWWLRTQSDEKLEDDLLQDEPLQDDSAQEAAPQGTGDDGETRLDDGSKDTPGDAFIARDDDGNGASESASGEEVKAATPIESRRRRRRRRRRKSATLSAAATDGEGSKDAAPEQAVAQSPEAPQSQEATSTPNKPSTATPTVRADPSPTPRVTATPATASSSSSPFEHNFVVSFPERTAPTEERKLALFCDFENIALGVRSSEVKKLDVDLILARLLEKGKIIVKRAYADWERYNEYKRVLHEAAIELIDIPQKYYSGKNSADIKMVVDAMDLCYSKEHLDTFVILSGDSDFSPLVSKLKENDKLVIGVGMKDSSSKLLVDNCDEFVYYEDIWRSAQTRPKLDDLPPQKAEVFGLMADAMLALLRENKEILWGSLVKQTMQRKRPSFNEAYYGYGSFSQLLEDAEKHHVIGLRKDERSGNYVVTGFVSS